MFFRLLLESFLRQRRRKLLAGIAILLGTTAVTAMLALATTIGDRIRQELTVYGANIVITPKAAGLDVKIGGVDIKPATGNAYLKESDLEKLHTIFWGNNITGVSPELALEVYEPVDDGNFSHPAVGLWFHHSYPVNEPGKLTGAPELHPSWKLRGSWPTKPNEAVVGFNLAHKWPGFAFAWHLADVPEKQNWQRDSGVDFEPLALLNKASISKKQQKEIGFPNFEYFKIVGVVSTGDEKDNMILFPLETAQRLAGLTNSIDRVEVSATTKPEDAFARADPDKMTPAKREIWYCRPYANSIAYQIREVMPDADAQQIRKVEQSEGTVLARISGLMWLISGAALLAAGFAVSAAMATAVLERRGEIGLMRSLGASKGAIALLFYAETGLLAIFAGTLGYLIGSGLAAWLGARIFAGESAASSQILNPVLLPVVVGMALIVAIAGSTPSIRAALRLDPSAVLRADA